MYYQCKAEVPFRFPYAALRAFRLLYAALRAISLLKLLYKELDQRSSSWSFTLTFTVVEIQRD